MPSLNFQKQFAPAVKAGIKRQTIRANGKRKPFKKGDTLYLFTGMRTRSCERLGTEKCKSAVPFKIIQYDTVIATMYKIIIGEGFNAVQYNHCSKEIAQLAKDDGFRSVIDFIYFFKNTHGLPFHGQLIKW